MKDCYKEKQESVVEVCLNSLGGKDECDEFK